MREFEHYHKLFYETTLKMYFISTEGKVGYIWRKDLKANGNRMDERLINWVVPKTIKRKAADFLVVVIDSQKRAVKNLVANAFIKGYSFKKHIIEHLDYDYTNCRLDNLKLSDRHNTLSKKAKDRTTMVIAVRKKSKGGWKHYHSITQAAEALFVFNDTLSKYLSRKTHYSVLQDYDFKINGVDFKPRKRTGANWKTKLGLK